jgi:hypothetical protein
VDSGVEATKQAGPENLLVSVLAGVWAAAAWAMQRQNSQNHLTTLRNSHGLRILLQQRLTVDGAGPFRMQSMGVEKGRGRGELWMGGAKKSRQTKKKKTAGQREVACSIREQQRNSKQQRVEAGFTRCVVQRFA